MTFTNTIKAARLETASKFALAEALLADIPVDMNTRNRSGEGVDQKLLAASKAIVDAGGEKRTASTLASYRLLAVWKGDSEWIEGVNFGTHQTAMGYGISIEELRSNPRTIAEMRAKNDDEVERSPSLADAMQMGDQDQVTYMQLMASGAPHNILEASKDWSQALREMLMAEWGFAPEARAAAGGGGSLSREERLALYRDLPYTESIPLAVKSGREALNTLEDMENLLWRSGRRLGELDARDEMTQVLRGSQGRVRKLAESCEIEISEIDITE